MVPFFSVRLFFPMIYGTFLFHDFSYLSLQLCLILVTPYLLQSSASRPQSEGTPGDRAHPGKKRYEVM